jgi:hypothetical protein
MEVLANVDLLYLSYNYMTMRFSVLAKICHFDKPLDTNEVLVVPLFVIKPIPEPEECTDGSQESTASTALNFFNNNNFPQSKPK